MPRRNPQPRTAAEQRRDASLLAKLTKSSDKVAKLEAQLSDAKTERDLVVKELRDNDVSYQLIAESAGMSISWINAALERTGGIRPRAGRPRRLNDEPAPEPVPAAKPKRRKAAA